jgi:hypothetical protein
VAALETPRAEPARQATGVPASTLYRGVYLRGDDRLTLFVDDLSGYERSNLVEAVFRNGQIFLAWEQRPIPARFEDGRGVNVPARDPADSWVVFSTALHEPKLAIAALPYGEYLKTDHWQGCRERAFSHYGTACCLCGYTSHLEVHHRNYSRLGAEHLEDLIVLCRRCHGRHHGKLVT